MAAFRIVGLATPGGASVGPPDAPLVGRRRELRALRATLRDARRSGSLRAVYVLGSAGIGKSRLAREVVRGARGFDTLVARCPAYGDGLTYLPVRELVGDDRDAILTALDEGSDATTVADRLVAFDGPASEIASAFARWCEARASGRPLLIVVDDLHWAEPTFLELLEHVAANVHGPVVLLGLTREELLELHPDALPGWGRVELEGLALADTEALVDHLLGGAPFPADSLARVLDAAEGNPLFLEQLVAFASEGESLGRTEPLPATLQALLAARLDRLGPGERAVLERAAVVGRSFDAKHVAALLDPEGVPTMARHLASLSRRGFVRDGRDGGLRFQHVLLQEAAYRAAPKSLRAVLHERLADALDRDGDAADAVVGYHLEQAYRLRAELGPPDRGARRIAEDAGRRLGAAGIRAWQRYDAPAAVNLLGRASGLLPSEDTRRLELLCELGEVFKWRTEFERAEAVLREVEEIASTTGNTPLVARARVQQAWLRFVRGETTTDEMLELTSWAIPIFEAHEDHRALGLTWRVVGAVHGPVRLQWARCADAASRAYAHYEQTRFSPAQCLVMLGAALQLGPEPVDTAIERCVRLAASNRGDRTVDAHMRVVLANLEQLRGNTTEAREHLRISGERIGAQGGGVSPDWAISAARAEADADQHETAAAILQSASDAADRRGDHAWVATLSVLLAEVRYEQGDLDLALELSTKAMTLALDDDVVSQVGWRRIRAKVLARSGGAHAEAERLARDAIDLLDASDAVCERAATLADLAEVLHLASRHAEAQTVEREAFGLFQGKGATVPLRRARRRLAAVARGPAHT